MGSINADFHGLKKWKFSWAQEIENFININKKGVFNTANRKFLY